MSFVFIEQTGHAVRAETAATRRTIRSQARLNATKEKLNPIYFRSNFGRRPHRRIYSKTQEGCRNEESWNQGHTPLCPSPSLRGYERAKIQFNFDLLALSGLTSIHMGAESSLSIIEPRIEQWVLLEKSPSYLDFVPAYYESSTVVKMAVDCTVAQYRHSLLSDNAVTKTDVLLLYNQALRALQDALNDPQRSLSGETMLAISVLQLYELVNMSAAGRWTMHFRGLMRLIEMRGPRMCSSSLERRIFTTYFGSIIAECFNHQLNCFLEQPGWENILVALAKGNSQLLDLLNAMYMCSAFARKVKAYILSSEHDSLHVHKIIADGLAIKDLTSWHKRYQASHEAEKKPVTGYGSNLLDSKLVRWEESINEMLCSTWAIHIVVNRLLVAIRPLADNAQSLELETQEFALALLDLQVRPWRKVTETNEPQMGLAGLHTHAAIDAKLAIDTKVDWNRAVCGDTSALHPSREIISFSIFERWDHGLRSKEPTKGPLMFSGE